MVEITGTGGDDTIAPLLNSADTLRPGAGEDRLEGLAGADSLLGDGGIDTLLGGPGDDTLDGGAGIDLLDGGTGTDWLSYAADTAGVSVDLYFLSARGGEAEGDSIAAGFEALHGGSGADVIIAHDTVDETLLGGDGADTLLAFGDFGTSSDRLDGGGGDDSIIAQAGANTLLGGAGADVLRGGAGGDVIAGGSGADTLAGGGGLDTLSYAGATEGVTVNLGLPGASGGDAAGDSLAADFEAVQGSDAGDQLSGSTGDDSLFGGDGADTLEGGLGHDWLAGGAAADRMVGGQGNDTYALEEAGDIALEAAGQGRDLVLTSRAAYVLGAQLDDLASAGGAAHRFTGNALANLITGGGGADTLAGGAGADTLAGGAGIDRLFGGTENDTYLIDQAGDLAIEAANQGFDTLRTTLANVALGANLEAVVAANDIAHRFTGNALANALTGAADADTLLGADGDDTLDGGAGLDRLFGGAGHDRYLVTAGDMVVEGLDQGQDTVAATDGTAHTLAANLEVLVLQGGTLLTGIGNALDNILIGNGLNNTLLGLAGADALSGDLGTDILLGGAGADTLTGGAGADRFRFDAVADSTPLAPDRIADLAFVQGDRIVLTLIDANTLVTGNQAFAYIGNAAFGGTGAASAGQLRVTLTAPGEWRAQGDVNGDGLADLQIGIVSAAGPGAGGWFIL
jgi:Ca2+-binding RTX toxin-like protein